MKIRVGLIGSGWSANSLAWAFNAAKFSIREEGFPEIELLRAMSRSPAKLESFARQYGFKEWTTDESSFFKGDLDVVVISTPNNTHSAYALKALESGADIIIEKPFAVSLSEAKEVVSRAEKLGRIGAICLVSRFLPASILAREIIARGDLGELREFRAVIAHAKHAYEDTPFEWRMSKKIAGGGVFADLGVHALDLAEHLTLQKITRIWGKTFTAVPERVDPTSKQKVKIDTEDVGFAVFVYEHGSPGTVEASKISPGFEEQMRVEVYGSKGGIKFTLTEPQALYLFRRETQRTEKIVKGFEEIYPWLTWPAPKSFEGWVYSYLILVKHFIDHIAGRQEQQIPTLRDGLRSQELLESFYESSEKGIPVDLSTY